MDGVESAYQGATDRLARSQPGRRRSFLFLQGPISDFCDRLGRALIARGHRVHRVNLHLGDQLFYRLPATNFRGRFDTWRDFVGRLLDSHEVTDLIVHGDRRPHHIVAAEEARARGIPVLATDLGYLRPDWITLEPDGMTTYSRFPRDPAAIRQLAERFPEPDLEQRFHTPFPLIATLDVIYNFALIFGRPLYPGYRQHGIFHPVGEYIGWLAAWPGRRLRRKRAYDAKIALQSNPGSYFLFPLQLATDYQIRAHSPYADARDAVREVIQSYARSGAVQKLAIVVHPLDNGLISWRRLVAETAQAGGISERVEVIDGGIPTDVVRAAAGVVTINSTVGVTALKHGVPAKVLGNAVFDIPGLTHTGSLDTFWTGPIPPDPEFTSLFMRALAGATQIKGGYYTRPSQARAIATFVERLESQGSPLRPAEFVNRPVRPTASTVVVTAIPNGLGLALARAYAAPGTALHLIGFSGGELAAAAEDCRRRGASVYTPMVNPAHATAMTHHLEELDLRSPIDVVVTDAATPALDGIAARMRRRGRGHIALIDHDALRPPLKLISDRDSARDLRGYVRGLQQRVRGADVTVSLVRPGRVAGWLAESCRAPTFIAIGVDRAAALIQRGLARRHPVIAFPGPVSATLRSLRVLPQTWRMLASTQLLASAAPIAPPIEEEPLRETGTGN